MSNTDEIRWRQRLEHFGKALSRLEAACKKKDYSDLERAGLVQMFEFTFELSWKVLKDLLFYEGFDLKSPREIIRQGYVMEYVNEDDSEIFLDALGKRNLLTHTYEEETALEAERLIKEQYYPMLRRVYDTLEKKQASWCVLKRLAVKQQDCNQMKAHNFLYHFQTIKILAEAFI